MEEKDNIVNYNQDCNVFNGPIYRPVIAPPSSKYAKSKAVDENFAEFEEVKEESVAMKPDNEEMDLCLFIHPSVDSQEERQVHDEIKRLVNRQSIQEICSYLLLLKNEKKVLLPQNAEKAYNELVRMGMPQGDGYSLKTFMKYYRR